MSQAASHPANRGDPPLNHPKERYKGRERTLRKKKGIFSKECIVSAHWLPKGVEGSVFKSLGLLGKDAQKQYQPSPPSICLCREKEEADDETIWIVEKLWEIREGKLASSKFTEENNCWPGEVSTYFRFPKMTSCVSFCAAVPATMAALKCSSLSEAGSSLGERMLGAGVGPCVWGGAGGGQLAGELSRAGSQPSSPLEQNISPPYLISSPFTSSGPPALSPAKGPFCACPLTCCSLSLGLQMP